MKGKRGEYSFAVLALVLLLIVIMIPSALAVEDDEYVCCKWDIENDGTPGNNVQTHISGSCTSYPTGWQNTYKGQEAGKISFDINGNSRESFFAPSLDGWVAYDANVGCITPPKCPHNIGEAVSDYCVCDVSNTDIVYKKDDGGICASSAVEQCTQQQIDNKQCGDWLMHSYDGGVTNKLNLNGANFFSGPLTGYANRYFDATPIHGHYVWAYLPEDTSGLWLRGSADDGMFFALRKLEDADLNIDNFMNDVTPIITGTANWNNAQTYAISLSPSEGSLLKKGWYQFYFQLFEVGGNEKLTARLTDSAGNDKPLKDVFTIMNSFGPVPVSGDNSFDECLAQGFSWIDYADLASIPSSVPVERYCCGDDEEEDIYVAPNGQYCAFDDTVSEYKWNTLENNCINDEGVADENTWFGWIGQNILLNPNLYDPAATNGADGCCGDDPVGDLGYITPDGKYICIDNRVGENEFSSGAPGNKFVWRDAQGADEYLIQQIDDTQFVSNGNEWYYCDALGNGEYGDNIIAEGDTLDDEFENGFQRCSNHLFPIVDSISNAGSSITAEDCSLGSESDCKEYYKLNFDDPVAFCFNPGEKSLSYDPADIWKTGSASFKNVCYEGCWVKDGYDYFKRLGGYISDAQDYDPCDILGNSVFGCGLDFDNDFNTDPDCIGLGSFDDDCDFNQYVNTELSCQEILDDLEFDASAEDRLCDGPGIQYCTNGGFAVLSSDSPGDEPRCCLGDETECAVFTSDLCNPEYIEGAQLLDSSIGEAVCYGQKLGDSCCIGEWYYSEQAFYGLAQGESFLCYRQGQNSFIQECCDPSLSTCYNSENDLNQYSVGDVNRVYSFDGVPLHTLIYFDDEEDGRDREVLRSSEEYLLGSDFFLSDWSSFDYLEFDIRSNSPHDPSKLILYDSSGGQHVYNFWDYNTFTARSHDKTNKLSFPLAEAININLRNVEKIKFEFSNIGFNPIVVLTNLYLLEEDVSGVNTVNRYCAGPWKQWISNLDGATDNGFVGVSNPERSDIDPYKYACEGQVSFAWTGTTCCGDDSNGDLAEYYFGDAGLCWDGSYITEDKTLEDVTGIVDGVSSKILFLNDQVHLCDLAITDFVDYKKSYDGTPGTQSILNSGNTDETALFGVYDDWLCQPQGWINKEEINKVIILASEMRELAKNDDYTLFCGDYDYVMNNYASVFENDELTDVIENACVLRLSAPTDDGDIKGEIIIGLIAQDSNVPFDSFENVLKSFDSLYDYDNEADFDLNCDNVPDNPADSEMFKACNVVAGSNDFNFYYNKPFNIMLFSDKTITGRGIGNNGVAGFFIDVWSDFVDFVSSLFGSDDYTLPSSVLKNIDLDYFYIAEVGSADNSNVVVGTVYNNEARIEYHNFATDMSILSEGFAMKHPELDVEYFPNNYEQIIYVEGPAENLDWKTLTSMLRIRDVGEAVDFGGPVWNNGQIEYPETCDIYTGTEFIFLPNNVVIEDTSCEVYDSSMYAGGTIVCVEPGYGSNAGLDFSGCELSVNCGDNVVNGNDECDDGNTNNNDACLNTCEFNVCGDGYLNNDVEECDDGNLQNGDGCSSTCELEISGPKVYDSTGNILGGYVSGPQNGCEGIVYEDSNGNEYTLTDYDCLSIPSTPAYWLDEMGCIDGAFSNAYTDLLLGELNGEYFAELPNGNFYKFSSQGTGDTQAIGSILVQGGSFPEDCSGSGSTYNVYPNLGVAPVPKCKGDPCNVQ